MTVRIETVNLILTFLCIKHHDIERIAKFGANQAYYDTRGEGQRMPVSGADTLAAVRVISTQAANV